MSATCPAYIILLYFIIEAYIEEDHYINKAIEVPKHVYRLQDFLKSSAF
jgi:hypothetical protein